MFVALRSLESCQARLESHREHGLRGELVQSEVLCPELRDQRLPAPGVQEVFIWLDTGGGGEGEQPHGLLDYSAVLQLRLGAEELLGVLHGFQPLASLHHLQILLEPDLELQTGLEFPQTAPVLVTPRETLAEVPPSQAVLNLTSCEENLNINTVRFNLSDFVNRLYEI